MATLSFKPSPFIPTKCCIHLNVHFYHKMFCWYRKYVSLIDSYEAYSSVPAEHFVGSFYQGLLVFRSVGTFCGNVESETITLRSYGMLHSPQCSFLPTKSSVGTKQHFCIFIYQIPLPWQTHTHNSTFNLYLR